MACRVSRLCYILTVGIWVKGGYSATHVLEPLAALYDIELMFRVKVWEGEQAMFDLNIPKQIATGGESAGLDQSAFTVEKRGGDT